MNCDDSGSTILLLFEELKQLQRIDIHVIFENLTMTEFLALRVIERCREEDTNMTNVSSIVEQATVSPQAVSKILGALEHKGYIVRSLNPRNHRHTSVSLTPSGQEAYAASQRHLEHYLEAVINRIGKENLTEFLSQLHNFRSACREELSHELSEASDGSI